MESDSKNITKGDVDKLARRIDNDRLTIFYSQTAEANHEMTVALMAIPEVEKTQGNNNNPEQRFIPSPEIENQTQQPDIDL